MGRPRRQILSNQVYEICFRTRRGLPFVATQYMKLIISSILANVQKDHKVILHHVVFMGNHPHMVVTAKDAEQCNKFYGEVQKQLTDSIKRLLGVKHLNLFKKNATSVVLCGDLNGVMERISYLYANPAKAHLTDTVERYPGFNTWDAFKNTPATLNAAHTTRCKYIRLPMIPKLPCRACTPQQDKFFTEKILAKCKKENELTIYPNAWMKAFGLKDEDVERTNRSIEVMLREKEAKARLERVSKGWKTKGASSLAAQELSLAYQSKSTARRIFVYADDPDIRIEMIKRYELFCQECKRCYQCWKNGDYTVLWPPGAFRPAMPPTANWFTDEPY